MDTGANLRLSACRARLRATREIRFGASAGNSFRGAIGFELPEDLFRPTSGQGPSGLRDRPRPFVIRASHLDGLTIPAGSPFELGLNVFVDPEPFHEALSHLDWSSLEQWEAVPITIPLEPAPDSPRRVRVQFLTPTELKSSGAVTRGLPPFEVLFSRLRDRISTLRAFYGEGPLALDFFALGSEAARVETIGGEIEYSFAKRSSTRTGQVHPLGGFTGWAGYGGDLGRFLPYLRAGFWTGVGRQTVWGNGWLKVELPGAPG
jgi:hypothetical protein